MAITTVLATDTLEEGRVKINANDAQALNQGVSPSNGLYPTGSLFQIPGFFNQNVPPIEVFHYGLLGSPTGTELDRAVLPKGFVAINLSMNIVNNWQWDNVQGRAEPFDTDFPMVAIENGGEGVICHYTPPGGIPATSFHEITRFGGGVDGLSGVNPYTTYVPFNQFKACIYACYSSTTTPPVGTDEAWWGGTGNTLGGLLNPLLWLRSEETKGSDFEFAAFEQNSSNNSPSALYFKKSRGTNQTKTAISSGDSAGRIGWKAYDGDEYHITAFMDAAAAATATNNVAPLDIRFFTSPNTTANFAERLRITNDGSVRSSVPIRGSLSTISGIPSYTAATSLAPTPTATEYANINAVSTANGGLNIVGLTNTTASAFPMVIRGIHGSASPTTPSVRIAASKTNGSTNFTDIAATEIAFQIANNATVLTETLGSGNTGFGVTTPTAVIHLKAGTATAGTAPLKFTAGTNLTTPVAGTVEFDGTNYFVTSSTTRYTVAKTLTATATLNFDLTAVNYEDLTITVTGAADGDAVVIGVPNGAAVADLTFFGWVSAANTVTIRASRVGGGGAADPASGTFRASVLKYA